VDSQSGETHWRTRGRDNIISLFGTTPASHEEDAIIAGKVAFELVTVSLMAGCEVFGDSAATAAASTGLCIMVFHRSHAILSACTPRWRAGTSLS